MRVRRDVGDTIARRDAELLQRARPAIASFEELGIGPTLGAIDDGQLVGVERPGTAGEGEGGEGRLDGGGLSR